MANVIPIFKKENRQMKTNYRPVSLLASLSKVCEKVVFIHVYKFVEDAGVFNRFQSGFQPGDSKVMHLVHIVNKIHQALENVHEVRAVHVFLDISKGFDKVWHKGLLAKLKSNGINGSLLQWFESYLTERYQHVAIEGTSSDWTPIKAGVPQGSVLGPLLFLVYIYNIVDNITSACFLFADDSLLLDEVISPIETANKLNSDLDFIVTWANQWLVTMNADKTKHMIFPSKLTRPFHPKLTMSNEPIDVVVQQDHFDVTVTYNLSWRAHVLNIHQKTPKKLNMLKPMKFKLQRRTLEVLYKSVVRSCLEYADIGWDGCCDEAARLVTGALKGTHRDSLLNLKRLLGLL